MTDSARVAGVAGVPDDDGGRDDKPDDDDELEEEDVEDLERFGCGTGSPALPPPNICLLV